MRRDWTVIALGLATLVVAGVVFSLADLAHEPRVVRGSDYGTEASARDCLDWWCRGKDEFLVALSAMLVTSRPGCDRGWRWAPVALIVGTSQRRAGGRTGSTCA